MGYLYLLGAGVAAQRGGLPDVPTATPRRKYGTIHDHATSAATGRISALRASDAA